MKYSTIKLNIAESAKVTGQTKVYQNRNAFPSGDTTWEGTYAFAQDSDRLYLHTGTGWHNIAIINTNPIWETQPSASYTLATDATGHPQPNTGTATEVILRARDSEGVALTWSYVADSAFGTIARITQDSTGTNVNKFIIEPFSEDSAGLVGNTSGTVTFKASDGVNIISASSTFTLQFDTTITGTRDDVFHMKAIGSAGGTNSTIVDSEPGARTWNGFDHSMTQGRFSPYSNSGYSWYFDGSSDGYVNIDGGSSFQLGTGDFTIECWFQSFGELVGGLFHLNKAYLNGDREGLCICFDEDVTSIRNAISGFGQLNDASVNDHSSYIIGGATAGPIYVEPNEWHHLAMVRASGVRKIYLDGVQWATKSDTNNYDTIDGTAMSKLTIGAYQNTDSAHKFKGWIADFRIVKGSAVYTDQFAVPNNKLEVISGTSVLACQNPAMVDLSTNKHTIDAKSAMYTTPYSPYKISEAYVASKHGGSIHFEGTALTTAGSSDTAPGTGAYTYDFWMRMTVAPSGNKTVFTTAASNTGDATCTGFTFWYSGNKISVEENDHASDRYGAWIAYSWPTGQPWINTWYHIAVSRDSSSGTLRLFVNGKAAGTTTSGLLNIAGTGGSSPSDSVRFVHASNGLQSNQGVYISDFRFIKGTGLYTSDFDLPTQPTSAVSGTQIKLNFTDAKIVDTGGRNNLNLYTGTSATNVQVETGVQKNSIPSVEFDGNEYLNVGIDQGEPILFQWPRAQGDEEMRDNEGGEGTWELWHYSPDPTSSGLFQHSDTEGGEANYEGPGITVKSNDDTRFHQADMGGGNSVAVNVYSNNTWHHSVLTKSYGQWINYVDGVYKGYADETTNDWYTRKHLTIGRSNTQDHWDGEISDFRISRMNRYPFYPRKEKFEPTTSWQNGITVTASNVKFLGCNSATITNDSAAGIDRSSSNQLTTSGSVTASTFAPAHDMRSVKFPASGNAHINLPMNETFQQVGNGTYTVECWIYPTQQDEYQFIMGGTDFQSATGSKALVIDSSNKIRWYYNGANNIEASNSKIPRILKNRWYHVAVTKEGTGSNETHIWINGHYSKSGTDNISGTTANWYIGRGYNWQYRGYISNVRITLGQTVYTRNFTPPGAITS